MGTQERICLIVFYLFPELLNEFDPDDTIIKRTLQYSVYLLHHMGLDFKEFKYIWLGEAPYSFKLTEVLFSLEQNDFELIARRIKIGDRIINVFQQFNTLKNNSKHVDLEVLDWLKLLVIVHTMRQSREIPAHQPNKRQIVDAVQLQTKSKYTEQHILHAWNVLCANKILADRQRS